MSYKHTTINITRPNGEVETVDVSEKFPNGLTDQMFAQIKKATMEAGKGEPMSYKVEWVEPTEEEMAEIKAHDEKVKWFERYGFSESDVR